MATIQTHIDTTTSKLPARIGGVDVARLYRAFVEPADYRGTERVVFVEASNRPSAIGIIAAAVAAIESRTPGEVDDRIINCDSAHELINQGASDDLELRLFETGWSGDRPTFLREALFLLDVPTALIRKWSEIPAAELPAQS